MKSDLLEVIKKAPYFAGYTVGNGLITSLIQKNQAKDDWLFEDPLTSLRVYNLASHAFILHAAKGKVYESHFKDGGIVAKDLDQWLAENHAHYICIFPHDFKQDYIDRCVASKIPYASKNILQMVRERNMSWLNGIWSTKDHDGQICSEFVANASAENYFCKYFNKLAYEIKPSMIQKVFLDKLIKSAKEGQEFNYFASII